MLVQISNNSRNPPEGLVQLVDMLKINCERMEHNLQMSGIAIFFFWGGGGVKGGCYGVIS